jgi:exopolyphosphatase / guanosine-5'-triphosphate,3'-diphosphate pyrophosphatase
MNSRNVVTPMFNSVPNLQPSQTTVAAIDLGSNSFRLEIARLVDGNLYTLDSIKETVRLAAGLDAAKQVAGDTLAEGLATIGRFGERLRAFSPTHVRAVATNTLRVARNAGPFLAEAEKLLGFPIEVIAGREEARLIYGGVAHSVPVAGRKRLVVDIGGGSTEFIVGRGHDPLLLESLYMGCVSYSLAHFPGGFTDEFRMKQAELAARREIQVISAQVGLQGWDVAYGASGTIKAVADILHEMCLAEHKGEIARTGLRKLRKALVQAGYVQQLGLTCLKAERVPVLLGGVAILNAVFSELAVDTMHVTDAALRTGVLYELAARYGTVNHNDKRDQTVTQFQERYQADKAQAARVASLALAFWDNAGLAPQPGHQLIRPQLAWAAALHEVGYSIAHNGYHKHSAYIIGESDMPGFSKREQGALAALVLGHAGKLPKVAAALATPHQWLAMACLRLAALFHRSRAESELPVLSLRVEGERFVLNVPGAWLEDNPLTAYSLEEEVRQWAALGARQPYRLTVPAIAPAEA